MFGPVEYASDLRTGDLVLMRGKCCVPRFTEVGMVVRDVTGIQPDTPYLWHVVRSGTAELTPLADAVRGKDPVVRRLQCSVPLTEAGFQSARRDVQGLRQPLKWLMDNRGFPAVRKGSWPACMVLHTLACMSLVSVSDVLPRGRNLIGKRVGPSLFRKELVMIDASYDVESQLVVNGDAPSEGDQELVTFFRARSGSHS